MSLWLVIALQAAPAVPTTDTFDLAASAKSTRLTVIARCTDKRLPEEVVVCGRRSGQYRLPLPTEAAPSTRRARGEAQSGMAVLTPVGRCGIFAGERLCDKREAAEYGYGYGDGRDPVTVLTRLARKAIDPGAE